MRSKPSGFQVFIQGSLGSPHSQCSTPSRTAARPQASAASGARSGGGAVARMKRSRAATIAAASSAEAAGAISYSRGVIKILDRPALMRMSCECYETLLDQSALLA